MKKLKTLFILLFLIGPLSLSVSGSDRNGLCNFLIELGENIQMDNTYTLHTIGIENVSLRHQKKIMSKFNLNEMINTTVNMTFLQRGLANICRYKKWEIKTVIIEEEDEGILLELHYARIPKETKSKNQAIWVKA